MPEDYKNKGKFIMIELYKPDHISKLLGKKETREYRKFIQSIKEYRNLFIHNPAIDVFNDNGNRYVIKKENRNEAMSWSNLRKIYKDHSDWFIDPYEMVEQDFDFLLNHLNTIWGKLISEIEKIWKEPKFDELLKKYQRDTYSSLINSSISTSGYPQDLK